MSEKKTLLEIMADYNNIEEQLYEAEGELTEATETALVITKDELTHKSGNYVDFILKLETEAKNLKAEIDRLTARMKTRENHAEKLRTMLKYGMETYNQPRIETLMHTILLSPSESVVINDEALIPAKFKTVKMEEKISKADIKKALKSGETVPGATIQSNKNLQIK